MKTKLYFRYGALSLLFLIQILFLLAIFREKTQSYLVGIFIATVSILALYTFRKPGIHDHNHEYESFTMIGWVLSGALLSYFLNQKMQLGPVLGAAITGVLASLIPELKKDKRYLMQIPPAIYCGAFVGMSSSRIADDFTFILTAGFFTGVLLVISKSLLNGIGGRLGTLAFLGVSLTYLFIYLLGN